MTDALFKRSGLLRYRSSVTLQPYDCGSEAVSLLCHVSILDCALGKKGPGGGCISDGVGGGTRTVIGGTDGEAQAINGSISASDASLSFDLFGIGFLRCALDASDEGGLLLCGLCLRLGQFGGMAGL